MILVIKLSGKVLEDTEKRLEICRQIGELSRDGYQMVIVHGGGKQLTRLSERLGIPTRPASGAASHRWGNAGAGRYGFFSHQSNSGSSTIGVGCDRRGYIRF